MRMFGSLSEKFRMRADIVKSDNSLFFVSFVYEKQITLDMTFFVFSKNARKKMILVFLR